MDRFLTAIFLDVIMASVGCSAWYLVEYLGGAGPDITRKVVVGQMVVTLLVIVWLQYNRTKYNIFRIVKLNFH